MKAIDKSITTRIIIFATVFFFAAVFSFTANAVGEAATYFEVFVPPNNDDVNRDVCLIVTAIFDNTIFSIVDDDMDGDDDDSVTGVLDAGQSYVLYIRDNGVNDDAPHSDESTSKQDGDYFIINSDNLVLTSQSTNSDWQHDWVPATNKSSKGEKFVIYSPQGSSSNRDLNVFAYEDSTDVIVTKISSVGTTSTGYTDVDINQSEIVLQQTLNIGEDIIFNYTGGRDLFLPGETYIVESSKGITVQYGALWKNARDGGAYVPSSNGASSGELFYFAVPYQSSKEQEINIVSWDDGVNVSLDKYVDDQWVTIKQYSLNALEAVDWTSNLGAVDGVFRVLATAGKKVSVFEANWLLTGHAGTSDFATMVSSRDGTTAGTQFLVYLAPPGNEHDVTDPFTGERLTKNTHAYLFSGTAAVVTVRDAYTMGEKYNKTFIIEAGRYADCSLDEDEWNNIYNGDGNSGSGPERPYLLIESDASISVFNTNFNDNWMAYFGTSQVQSFNLTDLSESQTAIPNETVTIKTDIQFNTTGDITSPEISIIVQDGAEVLTSVLTEIISGVETQGEIINIESNGQTTVLFDNIDDLEAGNEYQTETTLKLNTNYTDGTSIPDKAVITTETVLSGYVDSVYQQATTSEGITNKTDDQSLLLFSQLSQGSGLTDDLTNSWSVSVADIDNDGDEDLLFSEYSMDKKSRLYTNDGNGFFVNSDLLSDFLENQVVVNALTDYNNDGNLDIINGTNKNKQDRVLRNNGNTSFSEIDGVFDGTGYTHGIAFADVDLDGYADMFVSDYMPTGNNFLYINDNGLHFNVVKRAEISQANYSLGASFADYDNDGDADLFVPNDKMNANYLYENDGTGKMDLLDVAPFNEDLASSTGSSWGDYDNDGDLDLFVTNAGKQNNALYNNSGDGQFKKVASGDIVSDGGDSHGSVWADFDNDGDLDLLVTNDQDQVNFLYMNQGDGTFEKDRQQSVCAKNGNSFATAVGDLNNDGFLDVVISTHSDEPNQVFFNNGNENHWIAIKLKGTNSNSQAIGAKVKVKTKVKGETIWQMREVTSNTGGGANAQSSFTCHFGLGTVSKVDEVMIEWPSGYIQVLSKPDIDEEHAVTEEDGAMVSGIVFLDANENCSFDDGEELLVHTRIRIESKDVTRYSYTNDEGQYNIHVIPDNYTLDMVSENWLVSCNDFEDIEVKIKKRGDDIEGIDFGVIARTYQPDLSDDLSTTAFRRGFDTNTFISIANSGTANASDVIVKLELHENIEAQSSSVVWDEYVNNTIYWKIDELPMNTDTMIILNEVVSLKAAMDDELTMNCSVSSLETDLDLSDNSVSFMDSVVGAIDPNDLLVSPNGRVLGGTTLEYTVRFQNIGNYPATFVKVFNTLPDYVDESSFKMISASHHYELIESEGGKKEWFFGNIQLLDSVTNEPESHGYIKYQINVDENLTQAVVVSNSADIIFDYNEAIATNTTITPVLFFPEGDDSNEVHIYPNPATDYVNVTIGANRTYIPVQHVEILSLLGLQVYSGDFSEFTLEVAVELNLSPGIYYLKATGTDERVYTTTVVIRL